MATIVVDTRLFSHPEPLEMVMAAVTTLPKGDIVQMIHRFTPRPLFEILTKNGYTYHYVETEGRCDVFIAHGDEAPLLEALHV